jgi:hypothetical protein
MLRRSLLVVLLGVSTNSCDPSGARNTVLPEDWVSIRPPNEQSEHAQCANWALDEWAVELSLEDGASILRIQPAVRQRDTQVVELQDGRLIGENRGEFGGDVWWEPLNGERQAVARTNVVAFVHLGGGLFGLTGLAHLTLNTGSLVRFDREPGPAWRMEQVLDLGAAPYAFSVTGDGGLLVVLSGSVATVH